MQKIFGLPITGRLGGREALALAAFQYPAPLQPNGEVNRTEIDVTKQVLTLYENYQPRLITTTSTGSGEHYCYNSPRVNPTRHICEVATTPSGRFTYTRWVKGWDKSPLGQLYQPYYFNGGIAVHGYTSVPTTAGVARLRPHPDAHRASTTRCSCTSATRSTCSAASPRRSCRATRSDAPADQKPGSAKGSSSAAAGTATAPGVSIPRRAARPS